MKNLEKSESYIEKIHAEIPHIEKQIEDKNRLISIYTNEIENLEKENNSKNDQIEFLINLKKPTNESAESIQNKITHLNKLINSRNELIAKLSVLHENKEEIENKIEKIFTIPELDTKIEGLHNQFKNQENDLMDKENSVKEISANKYKLQGKIQDIQEKLDNLNDLGELCPICGSKLDDEHKLGLRNEREKIIFDTNDQISELEKLETKSNNQLEKFKIDLIKLDAKIQNLKSNKDRTIELTILNEKIDTFKNELRNLESNIILIIENSVEFNKLQDYLDYYDSLLNKIKEYHENIEDLKIFKSQFEQNNNKIKQNKIEIDQIKSEIKYLNENLLKYNEEIKKLETILNKVQKIKSKYTNLKADFQFIKEETVKRTTIIKGIEKDIDNLNYEIKEKENWRTQYKKLNDFNTWFNDYLIPTINLIEKHIMNANYNSFNMLFKKWFELLIDDNTKTGKINEEFTPIVEQDGYEQNINFLSGGEKTSVALAYRLALNNVVQKVSTTMESNLLILDEPTDGFSKEQLYKIRDILNELDSPQIILVSHERELESFADNIYRIEKINGSSKVIIEE
ncbi:MAG: SMC family ATPase [Methanobacterium sp. ERen5]|nr:MAG: SMC family ATPase [Methanobacterium sp. ERen5]